MITLKGRDILAKYLVGQIPAYASHIAIGSGPLPTVTSGNYLNKTELDFEMGRFPITSRSIVADKVVIPVSNVATTSSGQYYVLTVASHNFFVGQQVVVTDAPTFFQVGYTPGGPGLYNPNNIHTILSTTPTTITVDFGEVFLGTTIGTTTQSSTLATVSGIVKQISLTAELPYSGRYEITELGLYSSGDNPYVSGLSSQIVSNFLSTENWQLFTSSTLSSVPLVTYSTIGSGNAITITEKAFRTNSDNTFFNSTRIARQERPRFLQDTIILAGNLSDFVAPVSPATFPTTSGDYITLPDFRTDFSRNNPDDELRISYSLINSVSVPSQIPKSINIMLEFLTNTNESAKYLFRDTHATNLVSGAGPYASSRYKVKSLKISEGNLSAGFSWKDVRAFNIWANIESSEGYSGSVLTDFDICLDGIRIENKSNTNPLYGLIGYTVINTNAIPIVKNDSMSHQVEFRYVLGGQDNG